MTLACGILAAALLGGAPHSVEYFKIAVIDEQTGRGVPLVELQTTNNIRYYTDSNGLIAFHEPGLMDRTVFFNVKSHGYEFPKDGFGIRGTGVKISPGGSAQLKIKRINIAERLYRITGGGIYGDSVLLNERVPTTQPVLNALVFGSDSTLNAIYHGKLYWFWGDTNKPSYPLGNFNGTGATSDLPGKGGLDPVEGVDLHYFAGADGFARGIAPVPGDGPTWIYGIVVFKNSGRERMLAAYSKIRGASMETYERGMTEWNDDKQEFQKIAMWRLDHPVTPGGHVLRGTCDGVDYIYYCTPVPLTRVPAKPELLGDLDNFETFSCLKEGSTLKDPQLDRDEQGRLRYAWKRRTPVVWQKEQNELIKAGKMKPEEALIQIHDVETGKPVLLHAGTVSWNPHRRRWIMIFCEVMGTSVLGETWYSEADTPTGPWLYARKIVTHDNYSFYNPKHHPYFDQDGGRIVYFEGTYTSTFSGATYQTPRYDYNQIMYRLDLDDPRLKAVRAAATSRPAGIIEFEKVEPLERDARD